MKTIQALKTAILGFGNLASSDDAICVYVEN